MIINNPPKLPSTLNPVNYLQNELWNWMKNVSTAFVRLGLVENFEAQRTNDVVIAAGATAEITNRLNFIPSARIIVRQTGNGVITDGSWDIQTLRLTNNGAVSVTISVIFYR